MPYHREDAPPFPRQGPTPWLEGLAWASWLWGQSAHHEPQTPRFLEESQRFLKFSNDALKGFLRYQSWEANSGEPLPRRALWSCGRTLVYDYAPDQTQACMNVLCVPSLINKSTIFEGTSQHSFLSFLKAHHIRPFLIDWGEPGPEETSLDGAGYVMQRLLPAYHAVRSQTQGPLYGLGYCLGGLLTLGLAHHVPLEGIILMATPWDFSAYPVSMRCWASWAASVSQNLGFFPGLGLHALFQTLHGPSMVEKFQRAFSHSDVVFHDFVLLEDWLNEPVSLVGPMAHTLFQDWFVDNHTVRQEWHVGEKPVLLETLSCPALLALSKNDRIVPEGASSPLQALHPHRIESHVGHVGLMTSQRAPHEVWEPLVAWLHQNSKF